jgi:NADH:ubiquinone oxidoreductase subunit 3 (subunit A)
MSQLLSNLKQLKAAQVAQLVFNVAVLLGLAYAWKNKKFPFEPSQADVEKAQALGDMSRIYKPSVDVKSIVLFVVIGMVIFMAGAQLNLLQKIPVIGEGLRRQGPMF